MSPVGRLVFKTSEVSIRCLVGSTPTSSATCSYFSVVRNPSKISAGTSSGYKWLVERTRWNIIPNRPLVRVQKPKTPNLLQGGHSSPFPAQGDQIKESEVPPVYRIAILHSGPIGKISFRRCNKDGSFEA